MPATVNAPIELPGDSVPPLIMVLPTVPLPPSVAPASTVVSDDDAIEPLTESVPAFTVVAPEYMLLPASLSVPAPVLVRPPGPVMPCIIVKLFAALAISMPPPRLPRVMLREVELKVVPVTCSAPPLRVNAPEDAPRRPLLDTDSVPPDIVVPPL